MKITLSDIFNLTDSVIYNPDNYKSVSHVSIDSRTIKKNSIYVAIKGDKFDGHNFVRDAIANGASSVIIHKSKLKKYQDLDNITVITVPNTTIAYGELAKVFRNKFKGEVISITGSNGKTTTKEILATILSEKFKTEKTIANNNNHIGIPKTILSLKRTTEKLVLEHGTNHFDEIKYTANIAIPNVALITNIADSHLEYLIDREGVYKEKSSLFDVTLDNGGVIFVNNDDPIIKSKTKKIKNKITFGFKGKPDVRGKIVGYTSDGRIELSVEYKNKKFEVVLPLFGKSNAKNSLAAIAIALYLGVPVTKIKAGIKKVKQVNGRLFVEALPKFVLIDDTYNANFASVEAAVDLVKRIKIYKRKTLILGDMFELGKDAEKIHAALASVIIKNRIDNVLLIGKLMKRLFSVLKNEKINSFYFSNRRELKAYINKNDFSEQVVLVKGSRGMKMEEFVEQIRSKAK